MKRLAWILGLSFGVLVLLFAGLHAFLDPRWYRTVEGDGWRAGMPRLALSPRARTDGPWTMVESEGAAIFRVGFRPLDLAPGVAVAQASEGIHPHAVEQVEVPGIPGRFLLSGRGKHWRATLLFAARGRLFAVESEETKGNAAEPLLAVARIAASLEIDGTTEPPFATPQEEDLLALIEPAVKRHLAGMDAVFPVLVPLVALVFVISLAALALGGRVPRRAPGMPPPVLEEGGVFLEVCRGRWQRRQTAGAVVLDSEGLRITTFGREVVRVPAAQLATVRRDRGTGANRPFVVQRDGLVVRFRPGDPARWERVLGSGNAG